ncbi:MAG: hypothetical protein HZA53_14520 [Planctomycetes bacterium]|nr:hypothetical protein [Planctomycetota bacterium]
MREETGTFQDLRPAGADEGFGAPLGPHAPTARGARGARDARGGSAPASDSDEGAPLTGIELVPRSSGQILDTAFELLRGRFGLYVLAAGSVWFVERAGRLLLGVGALYSRDAGTDSSTRLAVQVLDYAAALFAHQYAIVFVALLAWPAVLGGRARFGASCLRLLVWSVPLFLFLVAVLAVNVLGVLTTCGLGFFYFPWKTTLTSYAFVLERAGFGGAFRRSFLLTSHTGWSNEAFFGFLRWAAVFGAGLFVNWGLGTLVDVTDFPGVRQSAVDATGIPGAVYDWSLVLLTTLVRAVSSAIVGVVFLAYYVDCRVRRDGLDLVRTLERLRAQWKSAEPAAVPPGGAS